MWAFMWSKEKATVNTDFGIYNFFSWIPHKWYFSFIKCTSLQMFAINVTQGHGQKEWAGAKLYPPFGKTCIVCSKRDMLARNWEVQCIFMPHCTGIVTWQYKYTKKEWGNNVISLFLSCFTHCDTCNTRNEFFSM